MAVDDRRDATPGVDVEGAITAVVRWAGRPEVRRELLGRSAHGLSVNGVTLLRLVVEQGSVRASELAELQGVDKSTITPQVRRLEQRGMVTRSPDPADGRAALFTATAQGMQTYDEMHAAGAAVFDEVLAGWSEGDRRAMAGLLIRFAAQLATRTVPADPSTGIDPRRPGVAEGHTGGHRRDGHRRPRRPRGGEDHL